LELPFLTSTAPVFFHGQAFVAWFTIMPKKIHPFTAEQLEYFINEIKEAGSADALMVQKEALKLGEQSTVIALYQDIESYKEKYLTGIYESLRPIYDTEVPYAFWGRLYNALPDKVKETI